MSDIQSLALRIKELSQSVDWWNSAILWSLIFTAIAAIAVVVTTRIALQKAKRLSDMQAELIQLKDSSLALALKEKDKQIALIKATSDGFERDIAQARQEAADAIRTAEREKLERIKIEERLAYRGMGSDTQRAEVIKALSPYRGTSVGIIRLGDMEANQFASDIGGVLAKAGWKVAFADIGMYAPPRYAVTCTLDPDSPAGKAFVSAFTSLHIKNFGFRYVPGKPDIEIFVGLKPPA